MKKNYILCMKTFFTKQNTIINKIKLVILSKKRIKNLTHFFSNKTSNFVHLNSLPPKSLIFQHFYLLLDFFVSSFLLI